MEKVGFEQAFEGKLSFVYVKRNESSFGVRRTGGKILYGMNWETVSWMIHGIWFPNSSSTVSVEIYFSYWGSLGYKKWSTSQVSSSKGSFIIMEYYGQEYVVWGWKIDQDPETQYVEEREFHTRLPPTLDLAIFNLLDRVSTTNCQISLWCQYKFLIS